MILVVRTNVETSSAFADEVEPFSNYCYYIIKLSGEPELICSNDLGDDINGGGSTDCGLNCDY